VRGVGKVKEAAGRWSHRCRSRSRARLRREPQDQRCVRSLRLAALEPALSEEPVKAPSRMGAARSG